MANRRNVLIGLGGLVAAGGAALGTGAFTTVTAERSVTVNTAGDANALLAFSAANDNPYVEVTGDNDGEGVIEINLDGFEDSDSGANSTGLNQNAITTFDELVTITNNGTRAVDSLSFEIDASDSANDGVLSIVYSGSNIADTDDSDDVISDASSGDVYTSGNVLSSNISVGSTADFGLRVDLLDDDNPDELADDAAFTLTISAEAVEPSS